MNIEKTEEGGIPVSEKLSSLIRSLLDRGIEYQSGIRKAGFPIGPEQVVDLHDRIMAEELDFLFTGYRRADGSEIAFTVPTKAAIYAEEVSAEERATGSTSKLGIGISYERSLMNPVSIGISISEPDKASVEILEDEGWPEYQEVVRKEIDLTEDQLGRLLEVVEDFSNNKDNALESKSDTDASTAIVDIDTATIYYFDTARNGYFTKEGIGLEEIDSDPENETGGATGLFGRGKNVARVVEDFSIQHIKKDDNPFFRKE